MEIPINILEKYQVSTNHLEDEIGTYDTFLRATDYKIIKIFENLLSNPVNFLSELQHAMEDNTEVVYYRNVARIELNKLLNQQDDNLQQTVILEQE